MSSHLRFALAFLAAATSARLLAAPAALPAGQDYATPRFTDPERRQKLASALSEIDREFREYAAKKNFPGLVWGVLFDGKLVHTGTLGLANVEQKIPVALDTRFRIASMTKSFTALAIMKLRDAGKLNLDEPAALYVPDLRAVTALTVDAPAITIRHLLTMSAGFPEDNPWGDRQLAVSVPDLQSFLRAGLSLSNPPGIAFEYSNLGYALLGQVISRVSGLPYQQYITREILHPLGMTDTVWEYADVPAAKLALGYRTTPDGWQLEPLLHDGTYGAMGGLLTTMNDFARYVRLHHAAWPARNDPDDGIVRRATLREMHQPAVFSSLAGNAKSLAGDPLPFVSAYCFGLSWTNDSRGTIRIGHSGGLPGFGSNWRFYPEHGFAVISFANLTYAGTGAVNGKVGAILVEQVGLPARVQAASSILSIRQRQVADLVQSWDRKLAAEIVAENFFLDRSVEERAADSATKLQQIGTVRTIGPLVPENQLRGKFPIVGETGRLNVFFTLTPERNPRVQELQLTVETSP